MGFDRPSAADMYWQETLGSLLAVGNVLERSASAVAVVPPRQEPTIFVRDIDDESLAVIERHAGLAVHLLHPASLQRVGEIAAERILITSAEAMDPAPLYGLDPAVRSLWLNGMPLRTRSLRLESLGALEELSVAWGMVDPETQIGPRLATLSFLDGGPPALSAVPASESLRAIAISRTAMVNLSGLDRFPNLAALEIAVAPGLRDLEGLSIARALESLELCRVPLSSGLTQVGALSMLHVLAIPDVGKVPTLGPLRGHQALRTVHAYGTTNIVDGDLTPLLEMPHLRQLAIADRRHYRPRAVEVKRRLGIEE